MEERKLREIEYYNQEAMGAKDDKKEAGSLVQFNPFFLASYRFLQNSLSGGNQHKKVLDYGCGTGVHLSWLAERFQNVTGVDLSQASINKALANKPANVELVVGDCENLPFANEAFDVVFDGGTFSSLDFEKALREIHRVLKPGGLLAGIETLGHNPLTNIKRKLNILLGKRTSWAGDHIFKMQSLEVVKKYFNIQELRFFHLISWVAFPLVWFPGGKVLLKCLEGLDHVLITLVPPLKKYSFKVVFVLKKYD